MRDETVVFCSRCEGTLLGVEKRLRPANLLSSMCQKCREIVSAAERERNDISYRTGRK